MFEKLIVQVLNKVLGDFIENIDPAQLNISVLNGNVSLTNMKLKPTLFDSMPFPFSLAYGQIGTINLKIPVWNLLSQPLVIEIRDVFAIVRPKHIKEWNEEVEIKSYQKSNQSMLEQYELFTTNTESLVKKDPSSIDKMVTKILDNLEISIKNIYVRYEDNFSASNHGQGKFVIGILLKEFSTFTTGADWKSKFMAQGDDITHKLAKIKNFTIFMDYEFEDPEQQQLIQQEQKGVILLDDPGKKKKFEYKIDYEGLKADTNNKVFIEIIQNEFQNPDIKHAYIVDRFSMEARIKLNKDPISNKLPQLQLDVLLGGQFKNIDSDDQEIAIRFFVHQPQIIRFLKLIEFIGYYNEFQKGALTRFVTKPLTQDVSDEYIKQYLGWKTISDDKKQVKQAEERRKLLSLIEDEYPCSKMIVLRKFANRVLSQKEEVKKTQDEIEQKVKDLSKQLVGWGLFTSKEKKAQQQKEIDQYRQKLQSEFQSKLAEDEQELDKELQILTKDLSSHHIVNSEDFDKMEDGYIRFKIMLKIPQVKLALMNEFEQDIFEAVVIQQEVFIDLGKAVTTVLYQISSFEVQDRWTGAASFPTILDTKELNNQGQVIQNQLASSQVANALVFKLSTNGPEAVSPFKISLKSEKTLFIVANFHFIKEVKRTVLSALQGEQLDFSFFSEAATERALQYMYAGKEFLEAVKQGEFTHQALDISIQLTAPIILVPENIFDCQKPVLIVDTGLITLESQLEKFDSSVNYKAVTQPHNIYDRYEILLSHFQISILEEGLQLGLESFQRGLGQQIIQKFDSKIVLFNCLEAMHPLFPTAELAIVVTSFEVQFGLRFIKSIINIQTAILQQLDTKEDQIFNQVQNKEELKQLRRLTEYEDIVKMRKKRNEQNLQQQISQNSTDDFYKDILEEADPEEFKDALAMEQKYSYKVPNQELKTENRITIINELESNNKHTNFKVYFAVEKLQLTLRDHTVNEKGEELYENIMNILLLHFGVEVEIDRNLDTKVNLSIYKFLIEDIQRDEAIAQPFRVQILILIIQMILSSPLNELARVSDLSENEDKYYEALNFEGSVMRKSMLSKTQKRFSEDDEFKDAHDSEENVIINEWELNLTIEENHINIEFHVQDLRFVFALPTAKKLIDIGLRFKDIFEDQQAEELESKKVRLAMYEQILDNLEQQSQKQDENLIRKIFMNYSKANRLDGIVGKIMYKEAIQRLYNLYDIHLDTDELKKLSSRPVSLQPQDKFSKSIWLEHLSTKNPILYEKTELVKSKVSVIAFLKHISVCVPLNAAKENSQVMQLSFISNLILKQESMSSNTYEITLNELIKKEPISSSDQLAFSISHFIVEMINTDNFMDLLNNNSRMSSRSSKYKEQQQLFNSCVLINPSRLNIQMSNDYQEDTLTKRTDLNISLEPIEIQVGFTHIDFVNMILIEVQKTLSFLEEKLKASDAKHSILAERKKLEVQKQELLKVEELKQKRSQNKLKPFRKYQKSPVNHLTLKFELESLMLSLNDDSGIVDQPLFQLKSSNTNVNVTINDKENDAASYMLKKLGIFQQRNQNRLDEEQYLKVDFFSMISGRYYNQRSLAFEPLLEQFYLIAQVQQIAQFTPMNLRVQSEKMLNINLTFGMALTIRKILDRIQESFKATEIIKKMNGEQKVTVEEYSIAKEFEKRMQLSSKRDEDRNSMTQRAGFIFENHTGLKVSAELHDRMKTDLIKTKSEDIKALSQISMSQVFMQTQTIQMSESIHQYDTKFVTLDELYKQHKQIMLRKNKGQTIESIEEEPMKMDFDIDWLDKLEGLPIETLGVHSYRTSCLVQHHKDKPKESFFGKQKPEVQVDRNVGVILNIKMDGLIKKVSLESQVLIANNLSKPVQIFVQEINNKNHYPSDNERATIDPDSVFKVPLIWLLGVKQYSLFVEARANTQMVLKNLHELFTDQAAISKLSDSNSTIIRLSYDYHMSVDVQSYTCLPKNPPNGPPQYLVSFNPPLMISNYNFQPLEIRDVTNGSQLMALMGPKESGYLNNIDGYISKPNLQWIYHDNQNDALILNTKEFYVPERLNQQQAMEKFQNNPKNKRDSKQMKLVFDIRKIHYQNIRSYQENFELRERSLHNITSSVQIMIYPKYMMINKTSLSLRCEKDELEPFTNQYFVHTRNKVSFQVPGYKYSQYIDVTTVGLSGQIAFDLNNKDDVRHQQLPQQNYFPQKIELGVVISTAPSPFNKTILISIVPRFLIVNQLGHPIILKQRGCKSQALMNGSQLPYNFEKNLNRQIMMRQPTDAEVMAFARTKRLYQDQADDELEYWSQPFSIDDIEDFQISYPSQTIHDHEQRTWYLAQENTNYQRYVRVIITTQNDATILVVLANPQYPEYEIVNKTDQIVGVAQMQETSILNGLQTLKKQMMPEEMIVGRFSKLTSRVSLPYVWADRTYSNRLLAIRIGNTIREINIDKAMQKTRITLANRINYNVEVSVNGNAKKIKISNINQEKESYKQALYLQSLMKRRFNSKLNIDLDLKGIGLSFIDDKPSELLFLSLYQLQVELQQWTETRTDGSAQMEDITRVKLNLKHIQLDNMVNDIMPVILSPAKSLGNTKDKSAKQKPVREIEESKEESKFNQRADMVPADEDAIPFVQLIITIAQTQDKKTKAVNTRLRAFQVQLQEFMFQAETSILNSNLKFVIELIQTFTDQQKYNVILADSENFERTKSMRREDICDFLNATNSLIDNNETIHANKMFIELIHLGAIKTTLTFKLEKKAFELDVFDPSRGFGILNLFYSILANVASISNSTLSFNELILTDIFVSEEVLIQQITKNYARQAVMQFYKLIGSSDIIGNPVGLVSKLGTGVYEFVSEPTKGLLKGPDEFVGGVGKGVQSLVSNVISGGFDSVSKITGSLYTVVKNVGGDKATEMKKPDHVIDGVYQGVKGGVSELFSGVTGIFTKPIEKTREEGAKGFFKGVGSGLFGALSAPVTATLRAGTSITQGVAQTAISIGNIGKEVQIDTSSVYARFRPPRYITTRNVITEFDEELALVSLIINDLFKGKYANQSIKYFCYLPETKANGEIYNLNPQSSLVIITESKILYLRQDRNEIKRAKPQLIFKSSLRKVTQCEVYQSSANNIRSEPTYLLAVQFYTVGKGQHKFNFVSIGDYTKLEKLYNLLSILPQVEGEDKVKGTKSKASQILEQCF